MRDIKNREDLITIMRIFYDRLLSDDRISFFFTKVTNTHLHLEEHFEILATFWEQSLFMKGGYFNNMFHIHQEVNRKQPFKKEHFTIWLEHFNRSIDKKYQGEKAEQMKTQAVSMATVMQIKFSQ
ncbi:MAG: group III truncated hemoglobin [Flavobacterium sp.]